ncbi:hypothetical protein OG271_06580 [Micromonospora rifamycinica]|nr:hypothetical protein [Micromonospora rifamycinica]
MGKLAEGTQGQTAFGPEHTQAGTETRIDRRHADAPNFQQDSLPDR